MFVHNHLNRPCYVGMAVVLQLGWGPLCSDTEFEHAFFFGVLKNLNHTFESWLRGSLCSELWILYKFQQWNQGSCITNFFFFCSSQSSSLKRKRSWRCNTHTALLTLAPEVSQLPVTPAPKAPGSSFGSSDNCAHVHMPFPLPHRHLCAHTTKN